MNEQRLVETLARYFEIEVSFQSSENCTVIGLVGGPASGKSTLTTLLTKYLGNATSLSTDDYVIGTRAYRRNNIDAANKDPTEGYDFDLYQTHVTQIVSLKEGETITVPKYDPLTGIAISADPDNYPTNYCRTIGKVDYLILEGDFQPLDRSMIDWLLYFDVLDEVRAANRMNRDTRTRGETSILAIIESFNRRQETQFIPYTLPHRDLADILVRVKATSIQQPEENLFKYDYEIVLQGKKSEAISKLYASRCQQT